MFVEGKAPLSTPASRKRVARKGQKEHERISPSVPEYDLAPLESDGEPETNGKSDGPIDIPEQGSNDEIGYMSEAEEESLFDDGPSSSSSRPRDYTTTSRDNGAEREILGNDGTDLPITTNSEEPEVTYTPVSKAPVLDKTKKVEEIDDEIPF